jgi:hypothetical protein
MRPWRAGGDLDLEESLHTCADTGTEKEVKLVLIEPRGVLNAGDAGGDRAAQNDVWI